uniref:Uncharacterized protein n=1 Tax=Arundo donax TaxID=35708 RepID=A0A0A9B3M1_ARUDO
MSMPPSFAVCQHLHPNNTHRSRRP